MKVYLAFPRGYCAGVVRAVDIVELALQVYGRPVYMVHQLVHNDTAVRLLEEQGAHFVEEVGEVPPGSVAIFSAHGVPPSVRERAKELKLKVVDATCPLVTKVHLEAVKYAREGYWILLLGHRGHVEVIGTMGEAPERTTLVSSVEDVERLKLPRDAKVAVLTQTTLSLDDTREVVEAIKARFPRCIVRNDICYATQNRQEAVKALAPLVELILVVGSSSSSNSNRLREVAGHYGVKAYLVNGPQDIRDEWLAGVKKVGVTSGASTPDILVQGVIERLRPEDVEEVPVKEEKVTFVLPKELRGVASLTSPGSR